ncbi:ABC transporter substrate-binding protein [Breznakiella homolactica]|uniref:Sugar ABC transporter substrate-binding protein n=1 Tax=Breznakiella homolactica TaxID=2798577 RepID=A0A7T8BCB0_9SPIR|nr:sugar ABC transporter substrate-binding protein [Breznakiella homolactica]QQO11241.1 sugar ABC transporter substrate-binding protein [Breznakiella homolactica]
MRRKMFYAVIALAAAVVLVTGCGNKSAAGGKQVTITFWDGNWNEETFPRLQQMWNEKYPDIKLVGEYQIDQGMFDKYMLSMQNGTAPDVVACALDWVTTLGNAGLLAPLDSYIAADSVDTSRYVPGAIKASTIGGKLYGLPFRSETYGLFYNVDLLRAAGYSEAPKTWDETVAAARAATKGDAAGYGVCGTNFGNFSFQYITMLRSSGGSILTPDNSKSALDSPVAIQTAELYRRLADYAPASMLENDNIANRTLFASGKVAMYMSGIYDVPEIQKANPNLNYACAMVPTANGATRKTILGGWSVAIPESSKNKDAAWKFVEFITSPEVAAIYSNTFTGTGAPAERFAGYDRSIVQPHADALQYAEALPAVGPIVGIRQAIFNNLQLALSDTETPRAAILKASDAVNKLLSEN